MERRFRIATVADARELQEIYAPYVRDTCISFETEPPTVEEMALRIAAVSERWPWLVCEEGGRILGYAYASAHRARAAYRWSVDAAVYVQQGARRRGIGTALYGALFPLLRLQGFFNAYAGITLPNAASVGLHEAMGFRPVGVYRDVGYKMGAWRDVGWWHLALRKPTPEPVPPVSIEAIRDRPEWGPVFSAGPASRP